MTMHQLGPVGGFQDGLGQCGHSVTDLRFYLPPRKVLRNCIRHLLKISWAMTVHFERSMVSLEKTKNIIKGIDPCRVGGIGSARRHDGGRPRDKASIAVRTTRSAF